MPHCTVIISMFEHSRAGVANLGSLFPRSFWSQPSDCWKVLRFKVKRGGGALYYNEAASVHLHNTMTGVQLLSRMLTLFVLLGLVLVAKNCIYSLIGQACAVLLFSKCANKITALIVYEIFV